MSVLTGPRTEVRRVLHDGMSQWVTAEGDELVFCDGWRIAEADATYLPPAVNPSKIICVHLNSKQRSREFQDDLENLSFFVKPPTALNSHRGKLYRPDNCQYLNYEGELVVQFGKPVRGMTDPEDIWEVLSGFCPGNDVGCQDFRDIDRGSMLRVKGQDGFAPIGPGMVSGVDVRKEGIITTINGKVVQEAPLDDALFGIGHMVCDLTRYMTFLPGDILFTGTPANSRPMQIGDVVEVEVTGVGKLMNTVAEVPRAAFDGGHQPTDSDNVRMIALGDDFVPREKA